MKFRVGESHKFYLLATAAAWKEVIPAEIVVKSI
jgi:hypothetical protein